MAHAGRHTAACTAHQAVGIARVVVAIDVRKLAAWVALHGALQGVVQKLSRLALRPRGTGTFRGTQLCHVKSMTLLPRRSMTGSNRAVHDEQHIVGAIQQPASAVLMTGSYSRCSRWVYKGRLNLSGLQR